jgi:hypothetical protein
MSRGQGDRLGSVRAEGARCGGSWPVRNRSRRPACEPAPDADFTPPHTPHQPPETTRLFATDWLRALLLEGSNVVD